MVQWLGFGSFTAMIKVQFPSQVALTVKNLPVNVGGRRDTSWIPGSGRFSGGENGNPLQYSYLDNSMDRGAWQATVHRVAKSWTQLKQLSTHAHKYVQRLKEQYDHDE